MSRRLVVEGWIGRVLDKTPLLPCIIVVCDVRMVEYNIILTLRIVDSIRTIHMYNIIETMNAQFAQWHGDKNTLTFQRQEAWLLLYVVHLVHQTNSCVSVMCRLSDSYILASHPDTAALISRKHLPSMWILYFFVCVWLCECLCVWSKSGSYNYCIHFLFFFFWMIWG